METYLHMRHIKKMIDDNIEKFLDRIFGCKHKGEDMFHVGQFFVFWERRCSKCGEKLDGNFYLKVKKCFR